MKYLKKKQTLNLFLANLVNAISHINLKKNFLESFKYKKNKHVFGEAIVVICLYKVSTPVFPGH